jgi:hypothetical protein
MMPVQQKGWCHRTANGVVVSLSVVCPDVCPDQLASIPAGRIERGVFYPANDLAESYFLRQREFQRASQPAQVPKAPHVYFIQSERGGPVKIGHARCMKHRLAGLQTAHPYPLVIRRVLLNAGCEVERRLHRRFAHCRLIGEWFELTPELEELINGDSLAFDDESV